MSDFYRAEPLLLGGGGEGEGGGGVPLQQHQWDSLKGTCTIPTTPTVPTTYPTPSTPTTYPTPTTPTTVPPLLSLLPLLPLLLLPLLLLLGLRVLVMDLHGGVLLEALTFLNQVRSYASG